MPARFRACRTASLISTKKIVFKTRTSELRLCRKLLQRVIHYTPAARLATSKGVITSPPNSNWSADKQVQDFGRTHRTDQTAPPIYALVFTELGEARFSATIARRLGTLGSISRKATGVPKKRGISINTTLNPGKAKQL